MDTGDIPSPLDGIGFFLKEWAFNSERTFWPVREKYAEYIEAWLSVAPCVTIRSFGGRNTRLPVALLCRETGIHLGHLEADYINRIDRVFLVGFKRFNADRYEPHVLGFTTTGRLVLHREHMGIYVQHVKLRGRLAEGEKA